MKIIEKITHSCSYSALVHYILGLPGLYLPQKRFKHRIRLAKHSTFIIVPIIGPGSEDKTNIKTCMPLCFYL